MQGDPEVEFVRGLETQSRAGDPVDFEFVPFVPDHRPLAAYFEKEGIDTVIQCGLVPDRSGIGSTARDAEVIATMCLGAAIGHEGSRVRSWVLTSSTAVYPIGSYSPLFQTEDQKLPHEMPVHASSIAEAEDYARDLAYRLPHVNVAILRLQQLVGEDVRGPLASVLARTPIPTPIGFDPTFQLLHLEDAWSATAFAAKSELAGIYNVASAGWIHLEDAIRYMGCSSFPVLPTSVAVLEPVLAWLRVPFLPAELVDLLRFGHTVETRKIERAGWHPRFDQEGCLAVLR
jgi:nucleoside-diphosphate-sugar epimerase